jgi:filamentous hemagglutinin
VLGGPQIAQDANGVGAAFAPDKPVGQANASFQKLGETVESVVGGAVAPEGEAPEVAELAWQTGKAAIGAVETVASAGVTSVYSAVENGVTKYVGITDNLPARAAAHLSQKGIAIREIPGLTGLARQDARAVEQVLIETHGLGKNGGTLLNKINSISQQNPIYGGSISLGQQLLQDAGYPGF